MSNILITGGAGYIGSMLATKLINLGYNVTVNKPVPRPEMLREMRLLLLEEGHCFRDQAMNFCKMGSPNTQDIMDGNSLTTLVQMVAAGFGVTLIPEMAVEFEGRIPNISIAKFSKMPPQRKIGMVWRRNSPLKDKYFEIAQIVKSTKS